MSFTFTAEDDDDNDDGESVLLGFGASLPSGITAGMPATSLVSISDSDVPQVTVQFGAVSYTVAEGDTEMVTITLSADPERTVTIPMETMLQNAELPAPTTPTCRRMSLSTVVILRRPSTSPPAEADMLT